MNNDYLKTDSSLQKFAWDDLKIILAIQRSGSLNQAAILLSTSQSTISRRLSELEEMMGLRLFERSQDGTVATQAARTLLPKIELMEQTALSLFRSVSGLDEKVSGLVRIALQEAMSVHLIIPKLVALRKQYPALQIELVSSTALVDLTRNEADLALRLVPPSRGDLIAKKVGLIKSAVYTAKTSPWTDSDLKKVPWIGWNQTHAHVPDAIWLQKNFPEANVVLQSSSMLEIVSGVQSGLGVGLLSTGLASKLGGLVEIPLKKEKPVIPLWLVYHRAYRSIARIQVVIKFIQDVCKELS